MSLRTDRGSSGEFEACNDAAHLENSVVLLASVSREPQASSMCTWRRPQQVTSRLQARRTQALGTEHCCPKRARCTSCRPLKARQAASIRRRITVHNRPFEISRRKNTGRQRASSQDQHADSLLVRKQTCHGGGAAARAPFAKQATNAAARSASNGRRTARRARDVRTQTCTRGHRVSFAITALVLRHLAKLGGAQKSSSSLARGRSGARLRTRSDRLPALCQEGYHDVEPGRPCRDDERRARQHDQGCARAHQAARRNGAMPTRAGNAKPAQDAAG